MRILPLVKFMLLIVAIFVIGDAFDAWMKALDEQNRDHVHRYQRRLYLGQFEPYPVECWADSHPSVSWPARKDGNCFLEDAPWRRSYLQ